MRHVRKGAGPDVLTLRWRAHLAELATGTARTTAWQRFNGVARVSRVCRDEQFGLCAWSEVRLDSFGQGSHVDHVRPKSKYPAATFEHANLVVSAFDSDSLHRQHRKDVFGGHFRGSRFGVRALIHPLQADCGGYFAVSLTGHMEPRQGLDRRRSGEVRCVGLASAPRPMCRMCLTPASLVACLSAPHPPSSSTARPSSPTPSRSRPRRSGT